MKRFLLLVSIMMMLCACALAEEDYAAYQETWSSLPAAEMSIVINAQLIKGSKVELLVTVEEDCFVYPRLTYQLLDDSILDFTYRLELDGRLPYSECSALVLDSWWASEDVYAIDRYGNEVAPLSRKQSGEYTQGLNGKEILYWDGMGLHLTVGVHTLTLAAEQGQAYLRGIAFVMPQEIPHPEVAVLEGNKIITLQAESVTRRNATNIRVAALYNTALTPYSTDGKRINYIEDTSWKYAGDQLVYSFMVEDAGWYGLSLRCRQTDRSNFPVYRTVMIDGQVPSTDFVDIRIPGMDNFDNYIVSGISGEPAAVYLAAGGHTITLSASITPLIEQINTLNCISEEMAEFSLAVSKITGGNTDTWRDFDLAVYGLDVVGNLTAWRDQISAVADELDAIAGVKDTAEVASLRLAVELLDDLLKKPNDLPKKLDMFAQGSSSARFYVISAADDLRLSPLGMDSLSFFQDERQLPQEMGFLESLAASGARFISSFSHQDYEAVSSDGETLQVWMARPRQLLEILQQMIDTQYTPMTGVKIDLSIMPDSSKLILANAAGETPDVAIGISSGSVFDMAVRGMLTDMRQFDTFKTVGARFPPGLLIPGAYQHGCYALPETFNFFVLFYRTDIMDSLDLEIPDTMDDVRNMLPTLQRYGMNFNSYVSNASGYKGFGITMPYVVQYDGTLYQTGSLESQLGEEAALTGVRALTNDFIIYSMDYEVSSFYQSFRDGTMPIGTSNMSTYLMLLNAAPEIAGKWSIAAFPGVADENGVVQRWTCNSGESSVIFSASGMQQEAWDFLDWYMSDEVQSEFGYLLQATMGNEYLWNSANLTAFLASSWPEADKQVIADQLEWTWEPSRMLGAYMVERELSNAVNSIVQDHENLRAAMDEAIKRINREVERKMEAYGLTAEDMIVVDVETVKEWLE